MQDPFAHSVRFYELDEGQFVDDLALYVGLADQWGDPILELGCGTGRVLAALAKHGYHVTGLDSSSSMLQAARERMEAAPWRRKIQLVSADMRDFSLNERFRWAFCALNSLMHLTTLEDQLTALRSIHRHLHPGGHLVLDLTNPDPAWLLEPEEQMVRVGILEDPATGHLIVRQVLRRSDPLRQILHLTYFYDEVHPDGSLRRFLRTLQLRYLFPVEARLLLEKVGFELEAVYGGYEMGPFSGNDERMILISRAV